MRSFHQGHVTTLGAADRHASHPCSISPRTRATAMTSKGYLVSIGVCSSSIYLPPPVSESAFQVFLFGVSRDHTSLHAKPMMPLSIANG